MKSKANVARLEELDDENKSTMQALLDLIKKQAELDKKLNALLTVAALGE